MAVAVLGASVVLAGCAGSLPAAGAGRPTPAKTFRVAVLPLDNLSGTPAPVKTLQQELMASLRARGVEVLPEKTLDTFMLSHRLRYVGGLSRDAAADFARETGVDAVLVTSLELYGESSPPRIALTARLVSTGNAPRIVRMESVAMAGDDSPGILGIGLIDRAPQLRGKAIGRLTAALLDGRDRGESGPALMPTTVFSNQPLDPGKKYTVAVLPFFNKGGRRYAGEIMALHFIRELVQSGRFEVSEPGTVREELLHYRIIMEEGVSLADADTVFGVMRVDLLVSGDVNDYRDVQGSAGAPQVDFTALLLNRDNRKAGWAVHSHATGNDRVYLFDFGRLSTANALAAAMIRGAMKTLTANTPPTGE